MSDGSSDDLADSDFLGALFSGKTGQAKKAEAGDKNGQQSQVENHLAKFSLLRVHIGFWLPVG